MTRIVYIYPHFPDEAEKRKKEELLRKRDEARHVKTAKAMASRTKDNLQFYTKEKLDRFVAEEKERERKKLEKEERKHQKHLERQRRREEGIKRKRRSKREIAKDKGQNVELPKPVVGVTIERKSKPKPKAIPKQSKPPLDFNALIRMAQEKQSKPEKQGKPEQSESKVEAKKTPQGRPMTKEEKERWERLQTKEYQNFLRNGGKRPEFPGAKRVKDNDGERSSRESSQEPKSNNKFNAKGRGIPIKGEKMEPVKSNSSVIKSTESIHSKRLNGSAKERTSKFSSKSKHDRHEESFSSYSPETEVNETVIDCRPSKDKLPKKRKSEEAGGLNAFDRIIKRYEAHRPPPGNCTFLLCFLLESVKMMTGFKCKI